MIASLWFLVIIAILLILGMTGYIGIDEIFDDRKARGIISITIGVLSAISVFVIAKIGIGSIERQVNTDQSVKVYDANGALIEQYEGKVAVRGSKITVEDKDGKKHVIYSNSGTVIVEEIE